MNKLQRREQKEENVDMHTMLQIQQSLYTCNMVVFWRFSLEIVLKGTRDTINITDRDKLVYEF